MTNTSKGAIIKAQDKGSDLPQKGIDTMKKMTYVDALNVVLADLADGEVKEKLTALRESIQKRNTGDRKPTKTQQANEALKIDIYDFFAHNDEKYTVTDLMIHVPSLGNVSNQKISALVRQMCEANILKREEIKHRAYFSIA